MIPEGEAERREIDERIADAYESKYALRPDPDEGDDSSWYRLRRSTALARARLPADGDPLYLRLTADEHLHAGD